MTDDEVADAADRGGMGRPFSDAGPTREYSWAALGNTWIVTTSNDRHHVLAAERFVSAAQIMLADMAVQFDAAKLLVQRAAWLKDNGKPFSQEAAMAKLFATDMAMKVTTDAVQVLGGSGYTQDFPVERAKIGRAHV